MTAERQNANNIGQAMGAKGQRTRRRIIDATVALLASTSLRDVRVAEIARVAEISSASFYVYFDSVHDVVLAAIAEIDQSPPQLLAMLAEPWPAREARTRARAFVRGYVEFWQVHRVVFRVRNLASEEGDERFRVLRENSIRPLLEAMAARIEAGNATPGDVSGFAQAGVVAAMLERISAIYGSYQNSELVNSAQLVEAAALVVADRLGVRE